MHAIDFHVVALGASAGGLTALEDFFKSITPGSRMAYIVIQHLSPDFESVMDQLLSRQTGVPVGMITDGLEVQPDHIYVLPPGKEAIITKGTLFLKDRSTARELTFPIDELFRSLAQDIGPKAISIVLSGTGTDGSRGIQDVHACGGLVMCQDEVTAKFNGMPRSACATGVVDLVLPPSKMPTALQEFRERPERVMRRIRHAPPNPLSLDYMEPSMRIILNLLNTRFGLDFTHYKAPMIARRIERRLSVSGGADLDVYARELSNDEALLDELYSDLLIGVTSFFRDREAWEALEISVIPDLISKLGPDEEFRAWVAGSATGEEAYSLGILLIEIFEKLGRPCNARVFASDVHEGAISRASQGVYSPDRVAGLLPSRLERFFEERPEGFRVSPEVRKLVVFTPHNVIQDAPFTRLDLVTCRNVLIYFNMSTQQKTLGLLSFGLKSEGVMCIGASESLGDLHGKFEPIDPGSKIFRKKLEAKIAAPPFRAPAMQSALTHALRRSAQSGGSSDAVQPSPVSLLSTYDRVLADFMPPGLLITSSRHLVHTFSGASQYMISREGRPSSDVLDHIHPSLKGALGAAIRRVCRDHTTVSYPGLQLLDSEGEVQETLRLIVKPYQTDSKDTRHLLILLESHEPVGVTDVHEVLSPPTSGEEIEAIDRELQITRENLQASIEELQAINEQHQSANEELTAANEELQSTNEELHSVNEELYTVNAEHQRKIDELTELTDDMDNLLTTTNVHTLFLDRELRLRRFTPRIAEFFNLIPQDIGRRIESFTNNLMDDNLVGEIRAVLETEQPLEREVRDQSGAWYLLRIFPYLSRGNVDGAVLTLVDISTLKQAVNDLEASEKRFNLAVRGSNAGVWDWQDVTQEYVWCSPRFYSLLGCDSADFEMTISYWKDLLHPDDRDLFDRGIESHLQNNTPFDIDCRIECGDETYRWFHCRGAAERTAGQPIRMAGSLEDITDRKAAQMAVRDAVDRRDQFLAMLSHELRNPLGAIINAVQLVNDDDTRQPAIDVITRQSRQMGRLLDDLLDVSRITHGKLELDRKPIDLLAVVELALQVVPGNQPPAGIGFNVELPRGPVYVNGDACRLQQVIVNLLGNAFKYTPADGDVSLTVEATSENILLEVSDTGAGIAPEAIDEVFELFVQSDSTIDRANGGMGVGLTLVKSVIEMHGGQVMAKSEGQDLGATFSFLLPRVQAVGTDKPKPVQRTNTVNKVVIIEDIDDARLMLEMLLRGKGYDVQSAPDGKSGYELIQSVCPDVAIIDIGLPELNGFEVAKRVRELEECENTKLVALTGYGQETDRKAVCEAGFDHHLIKPLKLEELDNCLMN